MLTAKGGVTGGTRDQATKDCSDTDTSASQTDCRETGTLGFGGRDNSSGHGLGNHAALLRAVADEARGHAAAGTVQEQAIGSGLLAGLADKRAGETG